MKQRNTVHREYIYLLRSIWGLDFLYLIKDGLQGVAYSLFYTGGRVCNILEVKDSSSLHLEKVLVVTLGLSGYLDMNLRVQQNCLVSMRHLLAGGYLEGATTQCNWFPLKKMPEGKREKKSLWKSEGSLGSV